MVWGETCHAATAEKHTRLRGSSRDGPGLSPGRLVVPQGLLLQELQALRRAEAAVSGAGLQQRLRGLGIQLQSLRLPVRPRRTSPAGALVRADACGTAGENAHQIPIRNMLTAPVPPPCSVCFMRMVKLLILTTILKVVLDFPIIGDEVKERVSAQGCEA